MGDQGAATAEFLATSQLFGALPAPVREALAEQLVPVAVPGGQVLLHQGDQPDGLYVVVAGRLRAQRADADGLVVLGEAGRGEVVGEAALLTEQIRTADVVALRDSELLFLPVEAFERLIAEHPTFLRPVTTQVVDRMLKAQRVVAPPRPIATVAVLPLHRSPVAEDGARLVAAALQAGSARARAVTAADAPAGSTDVSWGQALEAEHELVVYIGDPGDEGWTRRCLRQADLALLVADGREPPTLTAIDALVRSHRSTVEVATELVLVHPPARDEPRATNRWLESRMVRRHHHVHDSSVADAERVARLITNRGIGLVISGGGARSMAAVGVVETMAELGIPIDAVGGTSAGALVGGAVARGWSPERVRTSLRSGMAERSSPVDLTAPVASFAKGQRIAERLREAAGEIDLEDLWLDYFCVSTNLTTRHAHVHRTGRAWRALRASMSIPGLFPPVAEGDEVLVDGGLVDNLPVGEMRESHPGVTVIAVDVGVRRDLTAGDLPDSTVVNGWRLLLDRLHPRRSSPDIAGIGAVLTRLTELGGAGTRDGDRGDVVIRPEVGSFPLLDFSAFDALVAAGRRDGTSVLTPWWAARP